MNDLQKSINITFFGDSICVGQGVSISNSWVAQLNNELKELYSEHKLIISNSSVNGRTSREALLDMPYHIQSQPIDILVVQFGLNDCNYWVSDGGLPRVSLQSYISNMMEIVQRAFGSVIEKVIVNNNHPTDKSNMDFGSQDITYQESNKLYSKSLASEFEKLKMPNLYFVNTYEKVEQSVVEKNKDLRDILSLDGLHLSEEGHLLYLEIMHSVLKNCIDGLAQAKQK